MEKITLKITVYGLALFLKSFVSENFYPNIAYKYLTSQMLFGLVLTSYLFPHKLMN